MAIEIPSIEKLIEINRNSNRMLHIHRGKRKNSRFYICDFEGNEVKASPIRMCVLHVDIKENPYNFPNYNYNRPYYLLSVDVKPSWTGFITLDEAKLVLGKDYDYQSDTASINAMIEGATSGPGLANAYLLGESVDGSFIGANHIGFFPIQYLKINPEKHKELGIESDKERLDRLVKEIELE